MDTCAFWFLFSCEIFMIIIFLSLALKCLNTKDVTSTTFFYNWKQPKL